MLLVVAFGLAVGLNASGFNVPPIVSSLTYLTIITLGAWLLATADRPRTRSASGNDLDARFAVFSPQDRALMFRRMQVLRRISIALFLLCSTVVVFAIVDFFWLHLGLSSGLLLLVIIALAALGAVARQRAHPAYAPTFRRGIEQDPTRAGTPVERDAGERPK
jgi:hypothetical protein